LCNARTDSLSPCFPPGRAADGPRTKTNFGNLPAQPPKYSVFHFEIKSRAAWIPESKLVVPWFEINLFSSGNDVVIFL
jgi:hypothetical protein